MRKLAALNLSLPSVGLALAVLALLALARAYSFLLFHTLAELTAIVVYCAIFMFVWSSRRFMEDHSLLFFGVACLFIACLDMLHSLLLPGMVLVPGGTAGEAAQFWTAARLTEAASLLAVPLLAGRRLNVNLLVPLFAALTLAVALSILYLPVFPACRLPDGGATAFLLAAELAVAVMLAAAFVLLRSRRGHFAGQVGFLLLAAVIIKFTSSLACLLYDVEFGAHDFIALLLKIVAAWTIYVAVVRTGLVRPFDLLFRNLKMREREREELIEQLQSALNEVKVLSGMLPICAGCKQIRDDKGYWHQVEEYIHTHSETEFTHSYCPDCARKLLDSLD